ncbi:MAG: efflux RND transporter periplasmic adaptor subunit [Bacteroidales bacterium]|nr:efflux RND transporter periplasmic adaptor subunit [Bacteroidales bacterium]
MNKYILIIIVLLAFSCNNNTSDETIIEDIQTNQISFTPEQVDLAGIVTDTISQKTFSSKVYCKGVIMATPQNRAKISVPMEGYIKSIYIQNGQSVYKNTALVTLEHPAYIELQKNYLQTKSEFDYLKIEFERQEILYNQGAVNAKVYEQIKSEYETSAAQLQAYKLQLQMLNISTTNLTANNIRSTITVYSPIAGTINNLDITIGQYVRPEDMLFEVIDNDDFFLELHVFERDIQSIRIGQNVSFNCSNPTSTQVEHTAEIVNIGNVVDDMTKTFKINAKPNLCSQEMRHGMFINAEIFTNNQLVYGLPEQAVVQEGNIYYIFIAKDDNLFIKTPVDIGISDNGFFEIVNYSNLMNQKIVVSGSNYIKAEMDKE